MSLIVDAGRDQAMAAMAELELSGGWEEVLAKDLPGELITYVAEQMCDWPLDTIRKNLGIKSATDVRWRKLMTAIKGGIRIDGTGVFLKWMKRTDVITGKIYQMVSAQLGDAECIPSKTLVSLIDSMSNLQMNTIKMGKELGVFMDATQQAMSQGQGNGQVTIVVQTNVPTPDMAAIVVHQAEQKNKNDRLLADYELGREESKEDS